MPFCSHAAGWPSLRPRRADNHRLALACRQARTARRTSTAFCACGRHLHSAISALPKPRTAPLKPQQARQRPSGSPAKQRKSRPSAPGPCASFDGRGLPPARTLDSYTCGGSAAGPWLPGRRQRRRRRLGAGRRRSFSSPAAGHGECGRHEHRCMHDLTVDPQLMRPGGHGPRRPRGARSPLTPPRLTRFVVLAACRRNDSGLQHHLRDSGGSVRPDGRPGAGPAVPGQVSVQRVHACNTCTCG